MNEAAIERLGRQMTIAEITEDWHDVEAHYVVSAGRADTGFYSVSCSCGYFTSCGKSPATAHALMRAHRNGHDARARRNGGD